MTILTTITIYLISCLLALAFYVWDTTRCRHLRVGDLPLHFAAALLWPALLAIILFGFVVSLLIECGEDWSKKIVVRSRKKDSTIHD